MSDLAHIGHVELLTPRAEESLRFFEQVLGRSRRPRAGPCSCAGGATTSATA